MSALKTNPYKTTFILDLRSTDQEAAAVLSDLNELLQSLGADVSASEDLGLRTFARAADRRYTQGHYVEFQFAAASSLPAQLKDKLKLDKRINRIFVEKQ
jgi:ribosomal protein S6